MNTVLFMPDIMKLCGYDVSMVKLSQGHALIAVINRLVSSTSDILSSILDFSTGIFYYMTTFKKGLF